MRRPSAPRPLISRLPPVLLLGLALPLVAQAPVAKPAAKPAPAAPTAPAPPALPPGLADALASVDRGDLAGAIAKLEALRRQPGVSPQVVTALGAVYLKADRPADALAALGPLADAPDANPATLYNAGRAAFALGRVDLGTSYLERAIAIEPVSPAARELGLVYAREGRSADAYRLLLPWASASPEDVEARLAAALLALHFRDTANAEKLLAGLPTKNQRVQLLRGELALRQGNAKAAVALLKPLAPAVAAGQAVQAGLAADARRLLGEAYLAAGQPVETIRCLEPQARIDPSAALLVAHARVRQGDLKAGLATLSPWADKMLNTQSPRDPDLVADMALSYGRMLTMAGRAQEAAAALQVATRLAPQSAEAWQDYARALANVGRKDEATQALSRAKAAQAPKGDTPKGDKG
jgi:tetratricopeptide (TPR) repeat protein